MGIYEFNVLSLSEKCQLVWDKGVFLTNRIEDENGFNLYSIFDFFVEVEIAEKNQLPEICNLTTFKRGEKLNKYLDEIDLTNLFI